MKSKKLFTLAILFSLQSSCMDIAISEQNQHAIQEISIFSDLPDDLLPTIAAYSDCKTIAAWKQTCHKYNNDLHYHQVPTAIIKHENYNMITRGLMHIADTYIFLNDAYTYSQQDSIDINEKNFEKLLYNNPNQRITDLKLLGWGENLSPKKDIHTLIVAYKEITSSLKSNLTAFLNLYKEINISPQIDFDVFLNVQSTGAPHPIPLDFNTLGLDTIKRIIHVNPNIENSSNQSALLWACNNKNKEIIDLLIKNKRINQEEICRTLIIARANQHMDIESLLLKASPTILSNKDHTALNNASLKTENTKTVTPLSPLSTCHNWKHYVPHTVGITFLVLLLSYFFYTTTHNSVATYTI